MTGIVGSNCLVIWLENLTNQFWFKYWEIMWLNWTFPTASWRFAYISIVLWYDQWSEVTRVSVSFYWNHVLSGYKVLILNAVVMLRCWWCDTPICCMSSLYCGPVLFVHTNGLVFEQCSHMKLDSCRCWCNCRLMYIFIMLFPSLLLFSCVVIIDELQSVLILGWFVWPR